MAEQQRKHKERRCLSLNLALKISRRRRGSGDRGGGRRREARHELDHLVAGLERRQKYEVE